MGLNSGTTLRLWRAREFSVEEEAPDLGFILCSERAYDRRLQDSHERLLYFVRRHLASAFG